MSLAIPHQFAQKRSGDEDFPVASLLLPARVRRPILAFYRLARMADDLADDPALPAREKLTQLDGLEAHCDSPHLRTLLIAFRRDAQGMLCRDWDDLMDYCRLSAAPVGRFLLDLHGESAAAHCASDALCAALQVLNHVQDCGQDFRSLGRVYIPLQWIENTADLANDECSAPLRQAIDRTLDGAENLLQTASSLPSAIVNTGLRLQAAICIEMAHAHLKRLRRRDPLAQRLNLPGWLKAFCTMRGIARGLRAAP